MPMDVAGWWRRFKAVQGEFDLILMITHIEELRDSFPTKIQVTKTEAGSQVRVI